MYIGTYLATIRGLMDQRRYQNLFLFKKRSVAEHSWSVAKICQVLAYLEMYKYGNKVDMGLLLQLAITHDELEFITGDILSGTKRRTPAMREAVDEMEKVVFEEEYKKIIPSHWEDNFRRFTLEAKDDSMEGLILHAADAIDALLEAVEEIELGNEKKFMTIVRLQAEKLLTIELDSVKHFLKHSLADFGLDIRTYYGYDVYKHIQSLKSSDEELTRYVSFGEVLTLMKNEEDKQWLVHQDEQRNEVMRFRRTSQIAYEVIRGGVKEEIDQERFEIPTSAMLGGVWLVEKDAKDVA